MILQSCADDLAELQVYGSVAAIIGLQHPGEAKQMCNEERLHCVQWCRLPLLPYANAGVS